MQIQNVVTWVHLGKLERIGNTLNGSQVSKDACELKLNFSVSSSLLHLISWQIQCSMNNMSPSISPWRTVLHFEHQLQLELLFARLWTQQPRQFSNCPRSLFSSHLANEDTAGVNIKSLLGVNISLLEINYIALFSPRVWEWSSLGKSHLNIHDTALLPFLSLWVISQMTCFMTLTMIVLGLARPLGPWICPDATTSPFILFQFF